MEIPQIPGLERGALIAAFAGAMAVLCAQEKMPAVRAATYVLAGGITAAYVGPAIVEYLTSATGGGLVLGEKVRYGLIFLTGVSGIWIIQTFVMVLQEVQKKTTRITAAIIEALSKGGKK